LLDEIAGGLSEPEWQAMVGVVQQCVSRAWRSCGSSTSVHALRSAVDRLVAIAFGRSLMDGSPDAVMTHAEVQRVYLGVDAP